MTKRAASTQADTNAPRIVVVGGGAGGLQLVTRLARTLGKKGAASITLVDEALSHVWKPSLHEYAAGTKGSDAEVSFLEHANRNGYNFRLGRFAGVDSAAQTVKLAPILDAERSIIAPAREIPYDYLVIAIGSRSNDFGCKGVAENCWFLDTPAQSRRLQSELLGLCLRLETGVFGDDKSDLNVCIVGGGATGVELAAELREATEQLGLHGIDKLRSPHSFNITLIEAGPRLLAALPEEIAEKVSRKLSGIDVSVRVSARVREVSKSEVLLEDGTVFPSEMTIWAAGIKAPDALRNLDSVEHGSLGRLKVDQTLLLSGRTNIFAFGDCAECHWPEMDMALPPRAQVAAQQASFLASQLRRIVENRQLEEFKYVDRGSLVSIANSSAVGAFMGKAFGTFTVEGWFARMSYRYLHFAHESAVQGLFRAGLRMVLSKAMTRIRPRLKLH
jgi:NADH dehydrogenase